jgi:hypothetical protein
VNARFSIFVDYAARVGNTAGAFIPGDENVFRVFPLQREIASVWTFQTD